MKLSTTNFLLAGLLMLCVVIPATAQKKPGSIVGLEKTPFLGHIDVDYNAVKPGVSFQNLDSTFATYSLYWNNAGSYFATGIAGTGGIPSPGVAFMTLSTDLVFTGDPSPEFMRLKHSTGALGIGTNSPAPGSRLHARRTTAPFGVGVIVGEFAGVDGDSIAGVFGKNNSSPGAGTGVKGVGGSKGVEGTVSSTGGNTIGVRGAVSGGPGTKSGVSGFASGSGTNRGIHGAASGGTSNFAGYFEGQVSAALIRSTFTTFNQGLDLAAAGTSGSFIGITGRYTGLSNQGAGLFFTTTGGGLNVGSPNGVSFFAVNASAFNVSSDKNVKRDISTIQAGQAGMWMEQIRNIESATFWYNTEDKQQRPVPHIGVIAQSLPKELQTEISERPDGSTGNTFLGVSLSDWLGLVTIGVKENDRRIQLMEEENEVLAAENAALQARLVAVEEKAVLVEKLAERMAELEAALGAGN